MSTREGSESSLDATEISELVRSLTPEEVELFTETLRRLKDKGASVSDAALEDLAKTIAGKARRLAGDGGAT